MRVRSPPRAPRELAPVTAVGIAALIGFHVFGLMGSAPIKVIDQDDFIDVLATLADGTRMFRPVEAD